MIVLVDKNTLYLGLLEEEVSAAMEADANLTIAADGLKELAGALIARVHPKWNGEIIVTFNSTVEADMRLVRKGYCVVNLDNDALELARTGSATKGKDDFFVSIKVFRDQLAIKSLAMFVSRNGGVVRSDDRLAHPN